MTVGIAGLHSNIARHSLYIESSFPLPNIFSVQFTPVNPAFRDFLAILGDGGKLFIKSFQILIIFSLLIDEKRRKKTNYPKITDVQTRFRRC